MSQKVWIIGALILLLALFAGPVAYAQAGKGDEFVFNRTYVLRAGETLDGGLTVVSGSATLEPGSLVRQDVAAFGSTLTIAGTVRGNVAAFGGTVRLQGTAIIEGDFAAFGSAVVREPGAIIRGDSIGVERGPRYSEVSPPPPTRSLLRRAILWQLGTLGWALFMVALGLVAVALAPRGVGRVADAVASEPVLTFGLGLLTFIVAILAGALLLIACGLGLLVWLALGVAILLGWVGVGLWVGRRLLAALRVRSTSPLAEVGAGTLLVTVLARLPWCAGFLFTVIVGCIGLGAVVVTRFGTQPGDGAAPVGPSLEVSEAPARLDSSASLPGDESEI